MRVGVLGTGPAGRALGGRLADLGHDVVLGSRRPAAGATVTYAEAAEHAQLVINATYGVASLDALRRAGAERLDGKVLLDIANPLDHSHPPPPSLAIVNTDSLGERIQRAFPSARVVKALNTVTADVMVRPDLLPEDHTAFVAGEDAEAKATVADVLRSFGWRTILDLGGIQAARGLEMYVPLWLALSNALGTPIFNVHLVRS